MCASKWLVLNCYCYIAILEPFNSMQKIMSSGSFKDVLDKIHLQIISLIYVVPSIGFQTFFVQAFKIVVDSWKFTILLLYIEHQFLSGISDWRNAGSLWEMMRGVGGVRKSIHQSWLAKRLGLLCWGFKGVQEEIPSEEASNLQIGSVSFKPGQYTSPQPHPCHRLFDQDGHQDISSSSL